MAIAKLTVDLVAQLAGFERDLKQAVSASEKAAKDIGSAFGTLKAGLGGVLAGLSIKELAGFAKNVIDGMDALNDLKDATGSSIENLSALEDVAARTGTSFESMSGILVKFNKVLTEAKPGSETANILKQIGLSAEELRKQDPAEALRQTAVALSKFTDDGNKARVMLALFDKTGKEASVFLKDLADQGQLNAKVTTEQAQAAEDFNKQLFNLKKNSSDAARTLLSEFVPALSEILKVYNDKGLRAALDEFGERVFGWTTSQQRKQIQNVESELADLRAELVKTTNYTKANKIAIQIDDKTSELNKLRAQMLKLTDGSVGGGRGSVNPELPKGTIGNVAEATKKVTSEYEKYTEQLEAATLASLELSKEDEARIKIASGQLGALTQAQEEYLITLAQGIDLAKEKPKNFVDTSALEAEIALQREMSSLLQTIPTAKLEKQKKLQEALKFAFEQGTISVQQYHEALGELIPLTEKLADETNTFAKEAAANIQDELGNTLEDVLSGSFDNIGKNWERLLVRMAAQAAAAKLNQQLFGSDYGKTGQIGGLIGSLIGGSGGGGSGYPTIGGGAGDSAGYIIPSGTQSARGGKQSVTNNYVYNVAAGVTRNELITALQASNQAQRAETTQRLQRAGVA